MRRAVALGAGLAAGVTALALVAAPQVAGAVGSAVCSTTGRACASTGHGMGYGGPMMNGWDGDDGRSASTSTGNGNGNGNGMMGRWSGGMMSGSGTGMMAGADLGSGTLTSAQRATVAAMAEEEKLAHDVYTALAARYPSEARFTRIAAAETQHLAALRRVMTAYGITDPTAGLADGRFATASVQQLWTDLLAKATTLDAALAAGRTVETRDIADLDAAMTAVTTAPDVDTVYAHLRMASTMHLRAFGG